MRGWLVLVALAGWIVQPSTRETELTAEQIVERHLEALGGVEKIGDIKSLKKTGIYAFNGIEHPIVSYHKIGKKSREEISGLQLFATSFLEGHTVVRGTNGMVAWNKDKTRPPEYQPIPPVRAALMLEDADFQGALYNYREKGHRLSLEGRGEVEGTPTYRLELTLASGIVETLHIDIKTFLMLQIEVTAEGLSSDYQCPRAWYFDDYRPVADVLMPFWICAEERLFAREYIFEKIEANVTLDDAFFEPPEDSTIKPVRK